MDLDEMITKAAADLADAEAQFRAAQERMKELETIRDGLTLAKQRYGATSIGVPAARPEAEVASPEGTGPELPAQTDLCLMALREFGRTVTVQEVREKLAAAGHELTRDQVRNALGYLLRKKRIVRPAAGQWRVPGPITDVTPAAGTAGVNQAGGNGRTIQGETVPAGAGLNSQPARQTSF